MTTIRRLWAFLTGDMASAEDIGAHPEIPTVPWIQQAGASPDDKLATYAVEAARRSAEDANAGVKGIQDRAAGLLTLLIGLVPLLIAAIGLASPRGEHALLRLIGLVLYVGASFALVTAIVMAALATGLTLGGGLNLARLKPSGAEPTLAGLKADEADAWHFAAMTAMEAATRKARDLFRARQFMLWALILSIVGTISLALSVGGNLRDLLADPTASSSPVQMTCENRGESRGRVATPDRRWSGGLGRMHRSESNHLHACHDGRPGGWPHG